MEATSCKNDSILLDGNIHVDEFILGGRRPGKPGRSKSDKKEAIVAIKVKGTGIAEARCSVINGAGSKELFRFFEKNVTKEAKITTDKWRGYTPLKKEYSRINQLNSTPSNFKLIHRFIMGFKGWLRGIHHSVWHLLAYIDEYLYRFNRHLMKSLIFEELVHKMTLEKPKFRKVISSGN